jgi:opine dehydrogenase
MKHAAILGCGSGGMAMAADLGLKGFKVNLFDFPDFDANLRMVQEKGTIEATGALQGKIEPHIVTTNISEAIQGVDVIFMTIRSWGADRFVEETSKHIEPGQVLLNWSSYFSSLRTYETFKKNAPPNAILGEAAILPYFVKPVAPGVMNVFAVKAHLWAAAMPSEKTSKMMMKVKEFFPNCEAVSSVLETSFINPNLQVHVPPALLNTGTWEKTDGNLEFYEALVTPKVARVMEAVDTDRISVGAALGMKLLPKPEILKMEYGQYGVDGTSMYEVYSKFSSHRSWKPNLSLDDFASKTAFGEDLTYGYVPISRIGDLLGVETHAIDTMVNLAELVLGTNYWESGLTVQKLKVESMSAKEILNYIKTGTRKL